jgi:hypothetical protein
MRRTTLLLGTLAVVPLAGRLAAQDPGVSVRDFDAKRNGTEKMHMLARVTAPTSSSSRIAIVPTYICRAS